MSVVRRNIVWLLLSQGATWVVSLLLLIVAPRELGGSAFGQLSFAFAYVGFFELVALFGTGDYLTKAVAREPHRVGGLVANTLQLKFLISIVLIAVAFGVAFAIGFDAQTVKLIGAYSIGLLLNVINNALMGGLQGLQRMGRPAFWGVVRMYTGAALGLGVLYTDRSIVLYALAFNVVAVIPVVANVWELRAELRRNGRFDRSIWRQVLVGGFPFFILAALLAVYGSVDIPMLAAFADSETVGWYALAYRWVSMPAFFAAAVATAAYPALAARNSIELSEGFAAMANRALHFVMLVSLPVGVGIAVVATPFIDFLYGDEFDSVVPVIRLLAIHMPVVALDVVLATAAISADRQRRWMVYAAIAAVFNPLTNMAAIPLAMRWFDNGAIGAAFTTVLTEFLLVVGAYRLRPVGVFDRPMQRLIARIALASLAIVPSVIALRHFPLAVQVAAGAAAYVIASVLLSTVSSKEVRRIIDDLRRRGSASTTDVPARTSRPEPVDPGDTRW